jgi:hypothetical protein
MSRHHRKKDPEQVSVLAATPGRYLHLPLGCTVARPDELADDTVQVSVQVQTATGQPWRWMDSARDAFAALRSSTSLPIELWLTDGGIDALCLLALQPEALSIPVDTHTLTSEAAESLLRCFRQFEVVPILRVGSALPPHDSVMLRALQDYARPCWIHVDAPVFQDPATLPSVVAAIWPLVRVQRSVRHSDDRVITSGDSLLVSEIYERSSRRTVDGHRILLGCTDVREPCG